MRRWASKYWLLAIWLGTAGVSASPDTGSFRPPQPYELEQVYKQIKAQCLAKAFSCFQTQLQSITAEHGPRAAIEAFTLLQARGDIDASVDGHHIAHHIGHQTAMVFGATAQALALCPDSYNYGCMHGFFQHALGMGAISAPDAAKICDEWVKDPFRSSKTKESCYHGLGHGLMIHEDNDLHKALGVCDSLGTVFAEQGCWQGVFMENVDSAEEAGWQVGSFSPDDPLAPCDKVEAKYQYQCFLNQSARLMIFYHNDVFKAAQTCLKAPWPAITPCLETIGILTTNSEWQPRLLKPAPSRGFLENAWTICTRFPHGYVDYCMVAALDNLMNANTLDIHQARDFCHTVSKKYRAECRARLDANLTYLVPRVKRKHPPAANGD